MGDHRSLQQLGACSMSYSGMTFLWSVSEPWVYVGVGEGERTKWIPSYYYSAPGVDVCVRSLRGWKMRNVQGLMDEFGAALQFFEEFGENWPALEDCLRSLDEWLPAQAYVIVVERAEEMLVGDDDGLRGFLATVHAAGAFWSSPVNSPERFRRPSIPFHVLLNVSEPHTATIDRFLHVAESASIPVRTDWLSGR